MSREIDTKVAELVMEWKTDPGKENETAFLVSPAMMAEHESLWPSAHKYDAKSFDHYVPLYTTDPASDYEVLKRVRETWDHRLRYLFAVELVQSLRARKCIHPIAAYEPGDYSKAALAALDVRCS